MYILSTIYTIYIVLTLYIYIWGIYKSIDIYMKKMYNIRCIKKEVFVYDKL